MEIQINKEIRNYTESFFFGLSPRQCICSAAAIAVSVTCYLVFNPLFGTEITSWICILGAVPFAALGFVKYNGMSAEQLLWAWLRSEIIEPKKLGFASKNIYFEATASVVKDHMREEMNKHDADTAPAHGEQ